MKESQRTLLNKISINLITLSLMITFLNKNTIPAYAIQDNNELETRKEQTYEEDQDFINFLLSDNNKFRFNSETNQLRINDFSEKCIYGEVLIDENSNSLHYLNNFPNMEELIITDYSYEPKLLEIDGSNFQKPIKIDLWIPYEYGSFCEERYPFLRDIPVIDTLILGDKTLSEDIDFEFLQSLNNVHHLKIGIGLHSNIKKMDYSSFDSVELIGDPYDIAMYYSNEDIAEIQKETNLIIEDIDSVIDANNRIKVIAEELNLYDDSTHQEKLNRILEYILINLTYDNQENIESTNTDEQYYSKGYLTAALEGDKQVCGNYTALLKVLCREAGINCVNLLSDTHSWNAIELNGYYYFVDATEIDTDCEIIANDLGTNLEENPDIIKTSPNYLKDPTSIEDDENYELPRSPEGVVLKSTPPRIEKVYLNSEKKNLNGELYKITVNNHPYYFTPPELKPILEGLGFAFITAKAIHHHKKETVNNKGK